MEYVSIGAIANTHGLQGTLKIKSFTDFVSERYKKGNTLYIDFKNEYIPVTVATCRTTKGLEHVNFKEYNSINDVEKFKGSQIYIDKSLIHELDGDDFYYNELIGMEVYTTELIGTCIEIRELPQGELIVIKKTDGSTSLVPFLKHFVSSVDKEKKIIYINEMEGLL